MLLSVDFQLLQAVKNLETLVALAHNMIFAVRFVQGKCVELVTAISAHIRYLLLFDIRHLLCDQCARVSFFLRLGRETIFAKLAVDSEKHTLIE
jgi:RNase P subunit RPR2